MKILMVILIVMMAVVGWQVCTSLQNSCVQIRAEGARIEAMLKGETK